MERGIKSSQNSNPGKTSDLQTVWRDCAHYFWENRRLWGSVSQKLLGQQTKVDGTGLQRVHCGEYLVRREIRQTVSPGKVNHPRRTTKSTCHGQCLTGLKIQRLYSSKLIWLSSVPQSEKSDVSKRVHKTAGLRDGELRVEARVRSQRTANLGCHWSSTSKHYRPKRGRRGWRRRASRDPWTRPELWKELFRI